MGRGLSLVLLYKYGGQQSLSIGMLSLEELSFIPLLQWRFFSLAHQFSSVQPLSHVRLFATPWTAARQASLSITNSRSPHKPMSIKLVMPSNHLLLLLPSIFPSIRVFSNESALRIRWPKYLSFSFNISPSNEHPGPISFRMNWLHVLAVQGNLKSLLQHHSSKASVLWHSAFFIVQLSHPYMTTGKTIALTRRTFVGKVMSLLFNMHIYTTKWLKLFKAQTERQSIQPGSWREAKYFIWFPAQEPLIWSKWRKYFYGGLTETEYTS